MAQSICSKLSVLFSMPTANTAATSLCPSLQSCWPITTPWSPCRKFIQGEINVTMDSGEQRTLRSFPDWSHKAIPGDHLWVFLGTSSDVCYVGESDCSRYGPRLCCTACKITAHTGCIGILIDKIKFNCKNSFKDLSLSPPQLSPLLTANNVPSPTTNTTTTNTTAILPSTPTKPLLSETNNNNTTISEKSTTTTIIEDNSNKDNNNVIYHHWVHKRNHSGRCRQCAKSFQSKLPFSTREIVAISCSWCKIAFHNKENCFTLSTLIEPCTLGPHRELIIPLTWIVKLDSGGSATSEPGSVAPLSMPTSYINQQQHQEPSLLDHRCFNTSGTTGITGRGNYVLSSDTNNVTANNTNNVVHRCNSNSGSDSGLMTMTSGNHQQHAINSNAPTSPSFNNYSYTNSINSTMCSTATITTIASTNSTNSNDSTKNIATDISISTSGSTSSTNSSDSATNCNASSANMTTCNNNNNNDTCTVNSNIASTKSCDIYNSSNNNINKVNSGNSASNIVVSQYSNQPVVFSSQCHQQQQQSIFQIRPVVLTNVPSAGTEPLLVLINPRSGANQGAKMMQKFNWLLNPRQVFDLSQSNGPRAALELYRNVPNLRILAVGGDGTASWILSVLDELDLCADKQPPLAVLPLGTGNDLARALGWGGGYTDEPISKILSQVHEGDIVQLDRWNWRVERNPDAPPSSPCDTVPMPPASLGVINCYFSIGVDAHIALEFHTAREAHPERFNSRLRNKMFYGQAGGKDLLKRKWKDLSDYVTLYCDGQDMTGRLKDLKVHSVLCLNVPYFASGTRPWPPTTPTNLSFTTPKTDDGLIEVIGLTTYQLPLLQAGGHGTCIVQCRNVRMITSRTIPVQVDGEPCMLAPSIINIEFRSKSNLVAKSKSVGKNKAVIN
ncbi:Eye-specific diacylglycerol kinase, partial [Fragariocoptes setiger]